MNIKILLKAMSYMFLPTLAVLVMLLVGFFDPVAMWEFIKSNNGWAIFIRVVIFIIEIVCVVILYYKYAEENSISEAQSVNSPEDDLKDGWGVSSYKQVEDLGKDWGHKDSYIIYNTKSPNVKIVKRVPKPIDIF